MYKQKILPYRIKNSVHHFLVIGFTLGLCLARQLNQVSELCSRSGTHGIEGSISVMIFPISVFIVLFCGQDLFGLRAAGRR